MQQLLNRIIPVLLIVCCLPAIAQAEEADVRIKLKIGKDTTFFTKPVTDDGIIDYVAALNQHYGEGVKSEDNAFALLALLHPEQTPETPEDQVIYRDRLFKALAIEPGKPMPSLLTKWAYAADAGISEQDFETMIDTALARPWRAEVLPHVDTWLKSNRAVLDQVGVALDRPHYFAPLIRTAEDESLVGILLPQLGHLREASRLMVVRGMFGLSKNDVTVALEEATRLQKFGKLVSNEPTLIGVLVGISIQNMHRDLIQGIADRGELPHEQAIHYLDAYERIGTVDAINRAMNLTERSMTLDTIQRAWAGSGTNLHFFIGQGGHGARRAARRLELAVQSSFFDINHSLRSINQRYDELAAIIEIADPVDRANAHEAFHQRVSIPDGLERISTLFRISASGELPDGWTTQRFTDEVTGVFTLLLMANAESALRSQRRSQTRQLVQATAIALLGYRDRHGELPKSLDALVPTYLKQVPIDFATGDPLVYRVEADGTALVYSLGDNLKDDGGVDDYADGDIAIRIGVPKP
ncbi:MAG: hypothetical protein AAGI37_00655 [Planctomycetota bacterium]